MSEKIESVKFIPDDYCPKGVVICHPETSEAIRFAVGENGFKPALLSRPHPLPDCMVPDGGEGACPAYIEAQDRALYLENALTELEISFKAQCEEIDRLKEEIEELRASTPPTYAQGQEELLAAIKQAIERLEDIDERDGGKLWWQAKDILGGDLFMILEGLKRALPIKDES